MNSEQLQEIANRYTSKPEIAYTTAAFDALWQQTQADVTALVGEVNHLRKQYDFLLQTGEIYDECEHGFAVGCPEGCN